MVKDQWIQSPKNHLQDIRCLGRTSEYPAMLLEVASEPYDSSDSNWQDGVLTRFEPTLF